MRVVFAYRFLTLGGVETVLRARMDGLQAHGIEAHAWFLQDLGGGHLFQELRERVHIGEAAGRELLRTDKADLVCTIDTDEVIGMLPAEQALVVECHSPYVENLGYLRQLDPSRVRAILVPSQYQAEVVRERTRPGIDVRVMPNPLRAAFVAAPQPFAAPPRRPVVGWIGRMDELKNWKGFLALGKAMLAAGDDVELWMAGKPVGPADELWERMSREGVAGRLRWFRDLPHERVPAFLDAVRDSGGVLVSTSNGESFGMTVAEAMARGCAVAVPEAPPFPELVAPGRTGMLYTTGDAVSAAAAVRTLIDDDELRHRLAAAGREDIVGRFAPAVTLPRLAAELRQLAG